MSQVSDIVLSPGISGLDQRTELNDIMAAFNSSHKGASRPATAEAGTLWLDDSGGATAWKLQFYDGTDDIEIGTINTSANTFDPAGTVATFGNAINNKTGAYTVIADDNGKLLTLDATSAAFTLSITAAATLGTPFFFIAQKTDSSANAITIDPNASEQINNANTISLKYQYDFAIVINSGTEFKAIVGHGPILDRANTFTQNQTIDKVGALGTLTVGSDQSSSIVGRIDFRGHDSGGADDVYARINATVVDNTATSEDGQITLGVPIAGTLTDLLTINGTSSRFDTQLVVAEDGLADIFVRSLLDTSTHAQISFDGQDSGAANQTYSRIKSFIVDNTASSEDARLDFQTVIAGSLATRFHIAHGLYSSTLNDQGDGTVNAKNYYLNNVLFTQGVKLLVSGTLPSATSIDFDSANGVDVTNFPNMILWLWNVRGGGSAGQKNTLLRFSTNDGTSFLTTGYESSRNSGEIDPEAGTDEVTNTTTSTEIRLLRHTNLTADRASGVFFLQGFGSSGRTQVTGMGGGSNRIQLTTHRYDSDITANAFQVYQDGSGFQGEGYYALYGLPG